jgi:transposase
MRREIKIERARKLRAEGWTYQAIADRYGLSAATAYRYCNPDSIEHKRLYDAEYRETNRERRNAQSRAYRRRTRPPCPQCGNPMAHTSTLCEGCRADEIERRARQIAAWWSEGLTLREIAKRLEWTINHVQVEIVRLREKGYDLPYRHSLNGKAKFPEQVAA